MKPSDLFGVVVRTIGILIVLYSLYDFLGAQLRTTTIKR